MPNYPGKKKGTRRIVIWRDGKVAADKTLKGSKADGDRYEATLRLELEAHVHETRVAPNFSQLSTDKYSPFARANLAKSTWRARRNILASLCAFFGKKTTLQITSADTEAYKAHRREKSNLNPSSMNTELRALTYVLQWAKKQGYPVVVPEIRWMKEPEGRVRVWTQAQVSRLLELAQEKDRSVYRLLVFLANTGCRKGEGIAAEWSWIDLDARLVRIPATSAWSPKSGRAREVPISETCLAVLSVPRRSDRWVFANQKGERWAFFPDAIFKELQTAAGVTGGAHTLRHSYASAFLQSVPDIFLLAKILGHSHSKTTELYAHLLPDHLERGRDAVNIGLPPSPPANAPTEPPRETMETTVGRASGRERNRRKIA
jgi:integrase